MNDDNCDGNYLYIPGKNYKLATFFQWSYDKSKDLKY